MCGDVELAEDAAQDAFIQAWLNLSSFHPGTSLRNWLYRIAVNAELDVLRREPKTPFADVESLSMADPLAGPEAIFLKKERAVIVQNQGGLSGVCGCRMIRPGPVTTGPSDSPFHAVCLVVRPETRKGSTSRQRVFSAEATIDQPRGRVSHRIRQVT